MMGSTKLISSFVLLVYTFISTVKGHSETSLCPCEKEDVYASVLREYADLIEAVKQRIASGKMESKNDCMERTKPMDCAEVLRSGYNKSGVYTIWLKNKFINGSIEVYCDMDTDGGGWTVIQRRGDYGRPQDYFYRDWESYKNGFGDIKEDFWLGNDLIFDITNQARYSIRFDLSDFQGNRAFALYDEFKIDDEENQYKLHINGYSGNSGDSMEYHEKMKFSTKDRDNDQTSSDCAGSYKGAWWYNGCYYSNLNGLYLKGNISKTAVTWYSWKTSFESLFTTEMKIRPKSFHKV